jgi:hypothetical protein
MNSFGNLVQKFVGLLVFYRSARMFVELYCTKLRGIVQDSNWFIKPVTFIFRSDCPVYVFYICLPILQFFIFYFINPIVLFYTVNCYVCSINNGQLKLEDIVLTKSILENTKCFLLDCGAELFVWVGRVTQVEDRKTASAAVEVKPRAKIAWFVALLKKCFLI